MSPAEQANSCISVEFEDSDSDAIMLGHEVERLWNGGRYDEALSQLDSLEDRVGHVDIGNSWRKPVPTMETNLWGRDVRIGNRDSLMDLAFDTDPSTGNLFVVLRHNATAPHFSVCVSTDGGSTWNETFTWGGSPPAAIDAGVATDHFYVVYNSPVDDPEHLRLRRFRCADGRSDTLPGGGAWVVPCTLEVGTTMKEVSLASDQPGGRLYLYTLASDGSVLMSYWYEGAGTWSRASSGITSGANSGFDATYNQDADSTSLYFSYCDVHDTLRIYGGSRLRFSLFAGRGTPTSISTYHDRIFCMFEDQTSSPSQVRCVVNNGDNGTWKLGTLSNADTAAEAPAVVVGGNGMVAAVYRYCAPTRELRFNQRSYTGSWSDPVSIADHEPYWSRPGIQYLSASGAFGVVYLSNTGQVVRGAWFDRSDWVYGIAEQHQPPASSLRPQATIVHGVLMLPGFGTQSENGDSPPERQRPTWRGTVPIFRAALLDIGGRKIMELQAGANDVSRLAPGVYFIRAEADGRALTVPVTVVK